MKPDAIYKLVDIGGEMLKEEKKSQYLLAIRKLMHLYYTRSDIVFSVYKLT